MAYIEYRPALNWEDCLQCEEIQKATWWTPDGREIVPATLLITVVKNGGLLLGAFEGAKMVGFVFGFPGIGMAEGDRLVKHCSHMLAVLPPYRKGGLGFELKKRQREFLIFQQMELATWTYDPLQAINARLNVARLGGIVHRYVRDAYGEMTDILNAGVSSDRFEVEWWLNSHRVRDRLTSDARVNGVAPSSGQEIYNVEFDPRGLPRIKAELECVSDACWVEIPDDYNSLKSLDLELARDWRIRTRTTFESAFAKDYAVVDIAGWSDIHGVHRSAYLLQKVGGP